MRRAIRLHRLDTTGICHQMVCTLRQPVRWRSNTAKPRPSPPNTTQTQGQPATRRWPRAQQFPARMDRLCSRGRTALEATPVIGQVCMWMCRHRQGPPATASRGHCIQIRGWWVTPGGVQAAWRQHRVGRVTDCLRANSSSSSITCCAEDPAAMMTQRRSLGRVRQSADRTASRPGRHTCDRSLSVQSGPAWWRSPTCQASHVPASRASAIASTAQRAPAAAMIVASFTTTPSWSALRLALALIIVCSPPSPAKASRSRAPAPRATCATMRMCRTGSTSASLADGSRQTTAGSGTPRGGSVSSSTAALQYLVAWLSVP
mmetsp:Transcript_26901/g.67676  ORF Transcript_26901/g.67676 Transcript_26901/m.67676 type:complete len:318 (+) Transcript_26901:101-1054(+)